MVSPCLFIFIQLLVLLSSTIDHGGCDVAPPSIKLVKWLGTDSNKLVDWVDNDDRLISRTGDVFTVTSDATALIFQCKAQYPIKWVFQQAKYMFPREAAWTYIQTKTMRLTNEKSDSDYFAQLILHGDNRIFNGNYTCQKISQIEIQRNIYLYWEGAAMDQSLVHYGRNFTLSTKSQPNRIINLPCYVTRPDSEILLYKMEDRPANFSEWNIEDKWQQLQLNNSIEFDPAKGFLLNIAEMTGAVGRYKCLSATEGDFVIIDIVDREITEVSVTEEIKSNATFQYETKDDSHSKFTCCSDSREAPQFSVYYCDTPAACEMNRATVTSDWGYTVLLQRLLKTRRHINGSCVSLPRIGGQLMDNAVLVRCFGDGINMLRQLFFPLVGKTPQPYTNWSQAKKEDLILIRIWNIDKPRLANFTLTVFNNQRFNLSCKSSSYYYSIGSYWVIRYKDGNQTILKDTVTSQYLALEFNRDLQEIKTEMTIVKDMSSLSCYAPIWNSTEWASKTLIFNISTPELKEIEEPVEEQVYWTLNDTNGVLKCRVEGVPIPNIEWRKEGQLLRDQEYNITAWVGQNEIVSYLHVPNITHDIHGEYKCIAKNYAGSTDKIFIVFVGEKKPWNIILVVSFVIFWLVGGIVYFAWRMRSQKHILQTIQSSTSTTT